MRSKFAFLFTALFLAGLLPLQAFAAQDDSDLSPLSVTAEPSNDAVTGCEAGRTILLQLHYAGTQPLRGYLVVLSSNEWVTGIKQQTIQEILGPGEPMIQPGATWTRSVCLTTHRLEGERGFPPLADVVAQNPVTASVDVLKFADGSNWGPKGRRETSELLGAFDGMDFSVKATDIERYISPLPPDRAPGGVQDMESQKIGPLTFRSGVWRDDKGYDMLAVDATNDGDKAIRGYVFTEIFLNPAGGKIRSVTTKQLATHEDPSTFLAPGATWVAGPRKFSHLPDGSLSGYKITLDFVVFADGSTFGPKRSRESDELLGMIEGIRTANTNRESAVK